MSLVKVCSGSSVRNPFTKRCNQKCKSGFSRNSSFKCRKDKKPKLNLCPMNKIRNPKTNRCIKKKNVTMKKSLSSNRKASDFFRNPFGSVS